MVGSHERQREKPNQLKEQKVKSLKFFKPTLALSLGLHPSFRSAVAGKPPGERNVYMYDSIQLPNTASSRTTSQVTWPNDNKAVGNCFHALIAGLRPASLILALRIAFPLVLLSAGLVLIQPCAGQSGTWTPNGKVLVTGTTPLTYSAVAELYDPASGTWSATGSLRTAATDSYTATLLPNGKVLVVGGRTGDYASLASAELYDPAQGTWS